MTEPIRLPVRVLVKGASTTVYTSWMGGPRADFAWPRVVESELYAYGWPSEVRSLARPAELTKAAFSVWHDEVLAWSPDVVVLDYGRMECIHLFLPRWLERHAHSLRKRPFRVRRAYRKHVVRRVWLSLAHLQKVVDKAIPTSSSLWRVRRGAQDIEGLIERISSVASPLVLLPEIPPFGTTYQEWFPGANPRVDVMNQVLKDMVGRLGSPDIRFVPLAHIWEPLIAEGKDPCPDGGHYTPEVHRAVGEELAKVVFEWTEKQPHLLVEPKPRD